LVLIALYWPSAAWFAIPASIFVIAGRGDLGEWKLGAVYAITGGHAWCDRLVLRRRVSRPEGLLEKFGQRRPARSGGRSRAAGFTSMLIVRLIPGTAVRGLETTPPESPGCAFRDYFWATLLGAIPGHIVFHLLRRLPRQRGP